MNLRMKSLDRHSTVPVNGMRVIMARMSFAMTLLALAVGCVQPPRQQLSGSNSSDSKSDRSNSTERDADTDDVDVGGEQVADFKIRLELDSQRNEAVIEWDKAFRVVLINETDRPIRIWDPDSKQGFDQFEVHFRNIRTGAKHIAKRRVIDDPEYWQVVGYSPEPDSNVIEIAAKGTHEGSIELGDVEWGERAWTGELPSPNTADRFQVRLRFKSKPTDESQRSGVWTGTQTSKAVHARFTAERLKTPHQLLSDGFADAAIEMMSKKPAWIRKVDRSSCTPLHCAASTGPVTAVRWLLDHNADVNAVAYNGFTPLHLADDPEIIRLILTKKPDLTIHCRARGQTQLQRAADKLTSASSDEDRTKWQHTVEEYRKAGAEYDARTAIHLDDLDRLKAILKQSPKLADNFEEQSLLRTAASLGRLSICEYLIKEFNVDVNDFKRGIGYPIIKEAVRFPQVVKLLIDHGADLQTRISWHGFRTGVWIIGDDATALHYAADEGVPETIKLLIDGGVDAFATAHDSSYRKNKLVALEIAAIFGRADNAEAILNHPKFTSAAAEIRQPILDECLGHGASPMMPADDGQRLKLIRILLEAGANPNGSDDGVTPLQIAASQIRPTEDKKNAEIKEIVALLRKHGAKIDLFSAVAIGDVEQVRALLAQVPKQANTFRHDGYPAIHFAIDMDDREMVTALLKGGCDVDLRNKSEHTGHKNETPLHNAASNGCTEIAAQLIAAKADVNALDEHQFTPLRNAARFGNLPIVKLLIANGANLDARDDKGKMPLECCEPGFGVANEIRRVLQEAIAKKKP